MPDHPEALQEWWQAVQSIADLVSRDGVAPDEDQLIRQELREQGFSHADVLRALEWVNMAALSGHLMAALGMLQHKSGAMRVDHPLEQLSVPPALRRVLDTCRRRGLVSPDLAERLLESLRAVDSRDWEREELVTFLVEALTPSLPWLTPEKLSRLLGDKGHELYN